MPVTKPVKKLLDSSKFEVKRVDVYFRPEQVTQRMIDRILEYYSKDAQITTIARLINSSRAINVQLGVIDIYAILYQAFKKGKIKQRRKHLEFELRLEDFVFVFKLWCRGYNLREAIQTANKLTRTEKRKDLSVASIQRLYYNLTYRFKLQKSKFNLNKDFAASKLFDKAEVRSIDGREAFVIFKDTIPREAFEVLELPDSLDEECNNQPLETQATQKLDALLAEETQSNNLPLTAKIKDGPDSSEEPSKPKFQKDDDTGAIFMEYAPPSEPIFGSDFDSFEQQVFDEEEQAKEEIDVVKEEELLEGLTEITEEEAAEEESKEEPLTEEQKEERLGDIFS